ncbi:DUF1345 domain-containing protein [Agromyces laixinhei]|uniref:DUF1345 domain-containing protein n=1 Tax=Agromyces laixinhei TaxID=2585717 RepID=UPI0012ED82E7|nr:DUF1345 domain-containing protein [Agromyces laixinhei]
MGSAKRPRSDIFRVWVSSAVASVAALAVLAILVYVGHIDLRELDQWIVPVYAISWPVYTALYVGWGYRVYSRLDHASLRRVTVAENRHEHRSLPRFLGLTGTTNTTISAAVVAVAVTVAIAQQPAFRGEPLYIVLALLTVASSWILMVFSFAQSYLRLGAGAGAGDSDGDGDGAHFRFHLPDRAHFSDYITFAVLISTMAATTSADPASRTAWRIVRGNVVIAFVFNSVIIAMMVSFLFGGLSG